MSLIGRLALLTGVAMASSVAAEIDGGGRYGAPPEKKEEKGLIGLGGVQPTYDVDYASKGMREWDINGVKVMAATKKAAEKKAKRK